jgi:hypothetical protein
MHSMFDPQDRAELIRRIQSLKPDAPRQWGKMSCPQMIAHLTDQMGHCLGDVPVTPHSGIFRLPPVRKFAIYVMPWPRGKIQGPPEAFVTQPADWHADLGRLIGMVERFGAKSPAEAWPPHALFGTMTGKDWGVFCYKHFNHHLTQFGA